MEIERINENTVKFYISYMDIEERGFDREEIWYNRDKSEELFWEMMDEVHQEEDFLVDGPLWIQVQALDKGLEILVTKAQLTKDGARFELPLSDEKYKDISVDERIEELLDQHFNYRQEDEEEEIEETLHFIVEFKDIEDVISLSKRPGLQSLTTKLYSLDQKYYLYIEFEDIYKQEEEITDILSLILEYGQESQTTIYYLMEYGKEIIAENVFDVLRKHFV